VDLKDDDGVEGEILEGEEEEGYMGVFHLC